MGRRSLTDSTDVFRLKKEEATWNPDAVTFEGPYLTKGATKARMSFNRGWAKMTIQQLSAEPCLFVGETETEQGTFHDISARLVWKDLETFVQGGN